MDVKFLNRLLQATIITLTLAAVCQELEKPEAERLWCGKIAGFVPYDLRLPTLERLKETYWNPYHSRIIVPEALGVGWAINFYALLERLRLIGQGFSEEDFLMPGKRMKEVLTHALEAE
ncbi:MAG: hypothetical protein FJ015_06515 [Chloroflexi bacterium]|nr:hypothetical protein [Chloroflexota bacterium]